MKSIVILIAAATAPLAAAEPQVSEGSVEVGAEIEREQGSIVIIGEAASALFNFIAFRTRIENVAPNLRRARGASVACYEQFNADPVMEPITYRCEMRLGEYGAITAPP